MEGGETLEDNVNDKDWYDKAIRGQAVFFCLRFMVGGEGLREF